MDLLIIHARKEDQNSRIRDYLLTKNSKFNSYKLFNKIRRQMGVLQHDSGFCAGTNEAIFQYMNCFEIDSHQHIKDRNSISSMRKGRKSNPGRICGKPSTYYTRLFSPNP